MIFPQMQTVINYQYLINFSWQYYLNKKQLRFYVIVICTVKVKFINLSHDQIIIQNYLINDLVLFKCVCICICVFAYV